MQKVKCKLKVGKTWNLEMLEIVCGFLKSYGSVCYFVRAQHSLTSWGYLNKKWKTGNKTNRLI